MTTQIANGQLAEKFLDVQLPLQVLGSKAGFYIGTFLELDLTLEMDEMPDFFGPVSRESEEYFSSAEEAQYALDKGLWTQKTEL
ncbi:hypothetical protein [Leptospira borgpetersenii]|jgi:hypothetical protein|uniref:hypothetical protein n=1 Tax=Leptospira borgpetersenii TaxID=174 RepID=UPI00187F8D00|nr:hypothetical protein [Leptospira borgpetersenii]MBE8178428.1 hypothetical protein [Leptospira borgpetersenii serovar Ballum]